MSPISLAEVFLEYLKLEWIFEKNHGKNSYQTWSVVHYKFVTKYTLSLCKLLLLLFYN